MTVTTRSTERRRGTAAAFVIVVVAVMAVAVGLRIAAAMDAFSAEEIEALRLARSTPRAADLLSTARPEDSPLVTLFLLRGMGNPDHWFFYRLPAILAGTLAALFGGLALLNRGRVEALTAIVLLSTSYFLISSSSEALGYAPSLLFAMLAFWAARRHLERPGWGSAVAFAIAALPGFFCHVSFILFYFAILIWSAWQFFRIRTSPREAALNFTRLHFLPAAALVALTLLHFRQVLPGQPVHAGEVAIRAVSLTMGAPPEGASSFALGFIAMGLFALGILWLWGERSDWGLFFLCVTLVAPEIAVLTTRPAALHEHDFVLSSTFFLLLVSLLMGYAWRRGHLGKVLYGLVLLLLLTASSLQLNGLFKTGRNDYLAAMRFMATESLRPEIVVGSDSPHTGPVVDYYRPFLKGWKEFEYCETASLADRKPEWFVRESADRGAEAPAHCKDPAGNYYELARALPTDHVTGRAWWIYRRR